MDSANTVRNSRINAVLYKCEHCEAFYIWNGIFDINLIMQIFSSYMYKLKVNHDALFLELFPIAIPAYKWRHRRRWSGYKDLGGAARWIKKAQVYAFHTWRKGKDSQVCSWMWQHSCCKKLQNLNCSLGKFQCSKNFGRAVVSEN